MGLWVCIRRRGDRVRAVRIDGDFLRLLLLLEGIFLGLESVLSLDVFGL